jgi:hypothetical protein
MLTNRRNRQRIILAAEIFVYVVITAFVILMVNYIASNN